jgi:hypothetical protein
MASYVAVAALVAVVVWTLTHIPKEHDLGTNSTDVAKLREHLVLDIRGANHYCLGYIALLGVVGTMAASKVDAIRPLISSIPLWPFAMAFLASTLSLLFVPAGYGGGSFTNLRIVWTRTILCEQATVVAMAFGLWSLFAAIIGR